MFDSHQNYLIKPKIIHAINKVMKHKMEHGDMRQENQKFDFD